MADYNHHLAITSLTHWWEDMGVPVDRSLLARAMKASPATSPADQRPAPTTRGTSSQTVETNTAQTHTPRVLRNDPVQDAQRVARGAATLTDLKHAVEAFEGCDLKKGARNTVLFDGSADADVMIIGDAPGQDEEAAGKLYVGIEGNLFDQIFASIGLSRDDSLFMTNILPWRPLGNRTPEAKEVAICSAFLERQIELVQPKLLIAVGKFASQWLLKNQTPLLRQRGKLSTYQNDTLNIEIPCMPFLDMEYILMRGAEKPKVWQDLLKIEDMLVSNGLKRGKPW